MNTYLDHKCPVCNNSQGEEDQFCSSCGWVLMLPFTIVANVDTQFLAAEIESMKIRQNDWQRLQEHIDQVSLSKENLTALKSEALRLETLISLEQKKIKAFKEQIEQLRNEIKQLEESLELKRKIAQRNTKPVYYNTERSILPKIREKQAEIIDITTQIQVPRTIILIFNESDDLERYKNAFPSPRLVLGIHRQQKIYVVTQAEFVYKLPTELLIQKVRINGYPALTIQLPFDLHPNQNYILTNYSSVESFQSNIFFRLDLPELVQKEI